MRRSPRLLAALSALLACACSSGGPDHPPVEPLGRVPVVLLVFDAVHAGHIGHLGYERDTTPHLDALAAEGVSFTRAFAPAPFTLASIPSLLTGRLPDSHGVTNKLASLAPEETTLAELLKGAGYRTVGAVANFNGGRTFGNGQGFDVFREMFVPSDESEVDHEDRGGQEFHLASADEFLPFARSALERKVETPLFLYLHVLEPHSPYQAPDEFQYRWHDRDYDGPFASGENQPFVMHNQGNLEIGPGDVQAAIDMYDGNLAWADHNLGEMVALMKELEVWDDALVIVTSDHGEAFWEHDRWGHNDHLYDEAMRIPLVVKLPKGRGRPGLVSDAMVSLMDVVPSVCEWIDLPLPDAGVDGMSLAAVAEGDFTPAGGRELLLRSHHRMAHVGLRTDTHKTIVRRAEKGGGVTAVEHYELTVDPEEKSDLGERKKKQLRPLVTRLATWAREAVVNRSRSGRPLNVREQQFLEKLGYVDG